MAWFRVSAELVQIGAPDPLLAADRLRGFNCAVDLVPDLRILLKNLLLPDRTAIARAVDLHTVVARSAAEARHSS